ncbi:MAG TPA: hypothetical protein VFY83_15130 [Anaerolineales bacterium]|nr:hypothetical protein [Anaerolineales bacterium]
MTLAERLEQAGLPFVSATEEGAVDTAGLTVTPEQQRAISDIILEHIDPAGYAIMLRTRQRLEAAKLTAKAIPGWATWTQREFATWCDNNLMADAAIDATTLSAALKANIKANNAFVRNAGKMLIAMRDQLWADLPESS